MASNTCQFMYDTEPNVVDTLTPAWSCWTVQEARQVLTLLLHCYTGDMSNYISWHQAICKPMSQHHLRTIARFVPFRHPQLCQKTDPGLREHELLRWHLQHESPLSQNNIDLSYRLS